MRNLLMACTAIILCVWLGSLATGNLYPALTVSAFYAGIFAGMFSFLAHAAQTKTITNPKE